MKTWKWMFVPVTALAIITACGITKYHGMNSGETVNKSSYNAQQAVPKKTIIQSQLNHDKANHLVSIALRVPQVKGAYCLTLGNLAVVGVDVPAHMERSRVDSIKYSVAEALKKDPDGASALVTADLDLTQRIRDISVKINEGKPITAFTNELGDILGRLIPQLPQDTTTGENVTRHQNAPLGR